MAKARAKLIVLGGLAGILIIAGVGYSQFDERKSEIEKQIKVEVSFPPVGTTDGVYQYHVWLEGSEKTTMLHRVEINLDRVPAFSDTVSVSTIGNNWKPFSSSSKKGGAKGTPDDDVYVRFETTAIGYAKSWTLVELIAEVKFNFTEFWIDTDATVNFSFEVPAPYHRRQEGLVDKSIKWTSIDDMAPENEWETLEEK